jgi:hypothetical protein
MDAGFRGVSIRSDSRDTRIKLHEEDCNHTWRKAKLIESIERESDIIGTMNKAQETRCAAPISRNTQQVLVFLCC